MGMSFSSAGTGHRQPTRFPPGVSSMDAESEHILWTMRSPASVDRVITTVDFDYYSIAVNHLPAEGASGTLHVCCHPGLRFHGGHGRRRGLLTWEI